MPTTPPPEENGGDLPEGEQSELQILQLNMNKATDEVSTTIILHLQSFTITLHHLSLLGMSELLKADCKPDTLTFTFLLRFMAYTRICHYLQPRLQILQ